MEANHNNPEDAFKAFLDARGKTLVPMHYGTFDLSDEPPGRPLRMLREEAEKAGRAGDLRSLAINQAIEF
jgi:L-ascorbate metabolism protein UlaG (beta-lactamase superfamily)